MTSITAADCSAVTQLVALNTSLGKSEAGSKLSCVTTAAAGTPRLSRLLIYSAQFFNDAGGTRNSNTGPSGLLAINTATFLASEQALPWEPLSFMREPHTLFGHAAHVPHCGCCARDEG